ncbi:MAG: dienelactone hydrolase family protein [Pseudomonadota bacterium]
MTATIDGPRRAAASGTTKSLVVLLHGYGADGNDLFGLAEPLSQILPDSAFVSPNAPQRCANNPFGYQWFPIPWLDGSSEAARDAGFAAADEALNSFLDAELTRHGLDESAVALVGFSQGTMMSLHVGPRRATALAGIVGFSGRLLVPERLPAEIASRPPVLLVHGDQDEMVPVDDIHAAREGLAAAEVPVRWHISPGIGHGIAPDGLQLAASFLRERLGTL